ncbi:MAG: ABC-ATPase domain-containing protein, partial [Eubacteriales bacterium]|nr:ABC-ATPase domain-containing protein [Eubacteriales bacterium]
MYNGNRRYESSGRTKKVYGRGKGKATDRSPMKEGTDEELRSALLLLDHRSYAAYKSLAGSYRFGFYTLFIDHVQGDPFAAPSRLRVEISSGRAGFPEKLRSTPETRRALQDDLTRRFYKASRKYDRKAHGSGKSGAIGCSNPGQEILERSCCQFGEDGSLTFRFTVGFPAAGRTILAKELEKILFSEIPSIVSESLLYSSLNPGELRKTADLAEDQTELRRSILERGFIAFVADGSVLPRESGVSQKPLKNAVAFRSPDEDRISVTLPHVGEITGMGIRRGITLVIGGGYHGKSTLLQALERGVYDHIAGDGREFVVTDDTAVKIRAEDGRAVRSVNISPFIRDLPSGKKTESFSSDDASGSTSQAAA